MLATNISCNPFMNAPVSQRIGMASPNSGIFAGNTPASRFRGRQHLPVMVAKSQSGNESEAKAPLKCTSNIRRESGLRLLVKLGGAAITKKQEFETLNEPVLIETAAALARAIKAGKEAGGLGTVIVHGAGSFGHFQAAEGKVVGGGLDKAHVRKGFVGCRLATKKLQNHVLDALVAEGIEAVGISPLGKWKTKDRQLQEIWREDLDALLQEGFVPVLHGDSVFDETLGCTVLSGDLIMSHLAATEKPEACVFLTNVDGVFTKPPEEAGAELLREIVVQQDGTWFAEELGGAEISASNDSNDTTGGIVKKIEEAACIAREGVPVVIAKAGTEDAAAALLLGAAAFTVEGETMLGRPMCGTLVTPLQASAL